ncbi:MAG: ketoacyl-ACP synthase III [Acidobacteriota bacterium]|nr:ketoacyl-ACP synthase III [Acidobacteriota bacterium]
MAFLSSFAAYLPSGIVTNAELADRLQCSRDWISEVSGIEERRYAAVDESILDMGVQAARRCLEHVQGEIGMVLVSSGSPDYQFPGPASQVAERLGLGQIPALDIPMASAGALFAIALASQLTSPYGNILVVATEKMSAIAMREPLDRNTAILFGDGAGACLVTARPIARGGHARIVDSVLHSDGSFAGNLQLGHAGPLQMNGLSVILQASRKIPAAIRDLLERNGRSPAEVEIFLMHQANQKLIDRVARALDVRSEKFYSNIRRYGNTSSASLLIAAADWWGDSQPRSGAALCLATFGAGFHWGAILAEVE